MLRILRFSGHKILLFSSLKTTTTTFQLFSLHHHHHIAIAVFFPPPLPPPPPPPPPHFYCFPAGKACFWFAAYSMATSKDILFWTPSGQLLRNKRTIPVTNIAELVEYVLLPHNAEVTKLHALNTFLDGYWKSGGGGGSAFWEWRWR